MMPREPKPRQQKDDINVYIQAEMKAKEKEENGRPSGLATRCILGNDHS